jgi:hypothetical protein
VKLAYARTNANGDYSFAVPVDVQYFPAAFINGATIYTVVEPGDASFISTPSGVTAVSVDLLPFFLVIAAITGATLGSLYTRRMRGKAVFAPLRRGRAKAVAERLYDARRENLKFLYISRKGIKEIFRDRRGFSLLVFFPVVLIVLFAFAFGLVHFFPAVASPIKSRLSTTTSA